MPPRIDGGIVIHLVRWPKVARDVEASDDSKAVLGVPPVVHAASEVGQAAAGVQCGLPAEATSEAGTGSAGV